MYLQKTSQKDPGLSRGMHGLLHTSNRCAALTAMTVFFWMLPARLDYGPSYYHHPTGPGGALPSCKVDPVGAGTVAQCASPAGRENLPHLCGGVVKEIL